MTKSKKPTNISELEKIKDIIDKNPALKKRVLSRINDLTQKESNDLLEEKIKKKDIKKTKKT